MLVDAILNTCFDHVFGSSHIEEPVLELQYDLGLGCMERPGLDRRTHRQRPSKFAHFGGQQCDLKAGRMWLLCHG